MLLEYLSIVLYGYTLTVLIESVVLIFGLSRRHSFKRKLFLSFWLTACTYPIVTMALPFWFDLRTSMTLYLVIAETFAPLAECILFWLLFGSKEHWGTRSMWRDFAAIIAANLASFLTGMIFKL